MTLARRSIEPPRWGDDRLGLLKHLPGMWKGKEHGWNLIALPHKTAPNGFRLLFNQFDETLAFTPEVKNVPNRGIDGDQILNALQYVQSIEQVIAVDSEGSQISPLGKAGIHHEPGFFLNLLNQETKDKHGHVLNIARLGSVPHGDTVAALGNGVELADKGISIDHAAVGDFSALPIGLGPRDLTNPKLAPYARFHAAPFKGDISVPGFPGFDPTNPLALLLPPPATPPFKHLTVITLDTNIAGGIVNLPFITAQAAATELRFVLWIEELAGSTEAHPKFQLQYAQRVILEFFENDTKTGRVKWPHITINTLTLEK
jgi:hypothetical protein